jgi:hypothetical protein
MAQSSGANSYVAYIAETTYATTPATPELVGLPVTSFNVNLTKTNQSDNSINLDGQSRLTTFGNENVTGEIDDSLSSLHDALLESAMLSTFATGVLKMGSTKKSFTFEQAFPSTSIYRQFRGIEVDKMAITVPVNGDVSIKYNVIGKSMTVGSATIDTSGAITAPTTFKSMRHNGGTVKEAGVTIGYITNITLNVDNGFDQNFVLGSNTIHETTVGARKVTGSFTALFESSAIMTKFINGTLSTFEFSVFDGTNTYTFNLPNIAYTAATIGVTNAATIPVAVTFEASYDATAASTLVITKS